MMYMYYNTKIGKCKLINQEEKNLPVVFIHYFINLIEDDND